jgi:hypothetical protein
MMIELLRRDGYDVDDAKNLLPMPGEAKDRLANPNLIGHQGSHRNYNDFVKNALAQERESLVQRYGSLSQVPTKELQETAERIQGIVREKILKRDPRLPTRYDPETGTRILSQNVPNVDDGDFVV